jgi:hypothetical protein
MLDVLEAMVQHGTSSLTDSSRLSHAGNVRVTKQRLVVIL